MTQFLVSVRDPDYEPKKVEYQVGDEITCTARGRPDIYYQWQNAESGGKQSSCKLSSNANTCIIGAGLFSDCDGELTTL